MYCKPYIKLTDDLYKKIDKKLAWLAEASGVPKFHLPKFNSSEIPMFIRAWHCEVCGKFLN
jgi:hypothetical protein